MSTLSIRRGRSIFNLDRGFTLIELLVVIAIIGVLATLVLLQLGSARSRTRDAKRVSDVSQIRSALELAFEDGNGVYPANITSLELGSYLTNVPTDPLNSALVYGYVTKNVNRFSFQLWAELEQYSGALRGDADIDSAGEGWSGPFSPRTGGSLVNGAADDPAFGGCPTNDITDNNCVYDVGTIND